MVTKKINKQTNLPLATLGNIFNGLRVVWVHQINLIIVLWCLSLVK